VRMTASLVLTISLLLAACREAPVEPSAGAIRIQSPAVQMCGGGNQTDPYPDSSGVFLCSELTAAYCVAAPMNDADEDGLSDYCEEQLSYAFRPELRYWSVDDVRREPYWVARTDSTGRVFVGYLLGYYRDDGEHAYGCHVPLIILPVPASCNGHNGDSESLWLMLRYNATTMHWLLESAYYSAHEGWNYRNLNATVGYAGDVQYPAKLGGYPRVWVSEGKHAGYFSQTACNGGGTLGADDCSDVDSYSRLEWSSFWNLGSQAVPLLNGVASRNPEWYPASGRKECFWTAVRFRGWIPLTVGGDDSDPYLAKLVRWGFSTSAGVSSCETEPPPPPSALSVSIGESAPYYTAVASGGEAPYTYAWEWCALDCAGGESLRGGDSEPNSVAHGWQFLSTSNQVYWIESQRYLRVTATDAVNGSVQATVYVP
jgi:hypothetical protein